MHGIGDIAYELGRDIHIVDLLQMRLYVPGRHPPGVERYDLVVEQRQPPLMLLHDLGLECAVAVPGNLYLRLSIPGDDGLL